MKKQCLLITLIGLFIFNFNCSIGLAQDKGTEIEFTLEEITVTAEKREVNVQDLPGSVVALDGIELAQLGKITIAQILEGIPNVQVNGGVSGIAIRGVQQHPIGARFPAATGTYVDEVFEGIGGSYDLNHVEVLRGPQGTLYGRSATGGVVSSYTNNPKLSDFNGSVTAEVGKANLKNFEAAVNVPVGDVFALRVAAHWYEKDGYFNPEGDYTATKEARIKALYKPTDDLEILFAVSRTDVKENGGGISGVLTSPTTIDYSIKSSEVSYGEWDDSAQESLKVNYDFGKSTLTYIGAYREYKDNDQPDELSVENGPIQRNGRKTPRDKWQTHEIRWASDSGDRFTWLLGANYFKYTYLSKNYSYHYKTYMYPGGPEDPDPNTIGALVFSDLLKGEVNNRGIFTEETFSLRDDFRITGGLRYDKTDIDGYANIIFNMNVNQYGNSLRPENNAVFESKELLKYDNVTYKLRLEYDVSPENMLYAMTSTGFLPGNFAIGSKLESLDPIEIILFALDYDEEKLTAYELGSKNRFFNNRLEANASAFYYNYDGFRNHQNLSLLGQMPEEVIVSTPLKMYGVELATNWLVTQIDRVSFSAGWMRAKITDYPVIPTYGYAKQYMALEDITGIPELVATLSYDHVFFLPNNSTLVPRASLRYTSGYYLSNLTYVQLDLGQKPYAYQDSYVISDVSATWASPKSMYSVSAYVRNLTDKEYKSGVNLSARTTSGNSASQGDPRTWGMVINVKF